MNKEVYEALIKVLDYIEVTEQKHCEELADEENNELNHIYKISQKVRNWVDEMAKEYATDCEVCSNGTKNCYEHSKLAD